MGFNSAFKGLKYMTVKLKTVDGSTYVCQYWHDVPQYICQYWHGVPQYICMSVLA